MEDQIVKEIIALFIEKSDNPKQAITTLIDAINNTISSNEYLCKKIKIKSVVVVN